jgi:hypothetical protein
MLNTHFQKAAAAVKTLNSKASGMYGHLVMFAVENKSLTHEQLKDLFKAQEKLASSQLKVEMGKNSTYKVAKGKIIKAVELGIALVDANGKPVGKTDLEGKIKDAEAALAGPVTPKAEPTAFDKLQMAVAVASEQAKLIDEKDCAIAAGLVSTLYKVLADRIPQPMAA